MALNLRLHRAILFSLFIRSATSAKLRSWVGVNNFVEGDFPSPRYSHGLTAMADNKTYVFGGLPQSGNLCELTTEKCDSEFLFVFRYLKD